MPNPEVAIVAHESGYNIYVDAVDMKELGGVEVGDTVKVTIVGIVKGLRQTTHYDDDLGDSVDVPGKMDVEVRYDDPQIEKGKNEFTSLADEAETG